MQGFYYHWKNPDKFYYVLGSGINRTNDRKEVCYLSLYDNLMHFRDLVEWHQWVTLPLTEEDEELFARTGNCPARVSPRFIKVEPNIDMVLNMIATLGRHTEAYNDVLNG